MTTNIPKLKRTLAKLCTSTERRGNIAKFYC